ncbi:MAG: hypothetical protein JXR48_06715 [Candidatus Delongbacteria bacterium]|nr:hypothetical protein [Candidatus Delongbacteria bacterium]
MSGDALSIFKKEFDILDHNIQVLSDTHMSIEKLFEEYLQLSEHYEKLFKYSIKMTKIGDINTRKMIKNIELAENEKEKIEYKAKEILKVSFVAGNIDSDQADKLNQMSQAMSTMIQNTQLLLKTLNIEDLSEEQNKIIGRISKSSEKVVSLAKSHTEF